MLDFPKSLIHSALNKALQRLSYVLKIHAHLFTLVSAPPTRIQLPVPCGGEIHQQTPAMWTVEI